MRSNRSNAQLQKRDVNAVNRVAKALELRAQKMTYEEIAKRCGYATRSACRQAVLRELDRVIVRNVDELRQEECLTLDALQYECSLIAFDREQNGRFAAIDRIVDIMERRAKLLGLDVKPEQEQIKANVVIRELPAGYFVDATPDTPTS